MKGDAIKNRSNPTGALFMMLYLVIPMFIRGLRYDMIINGQKQNGKELK